MNKFIYVALFFIVFGSFVSPTRAITNSAERCNIEYFKANPKVVTVSQNLTLSWKTKNCNYIYIDNQVVYGATGSVNYYSAQGWPGIQTFRISASKFILPGCTPMNGYAGTSVNGQPCNSTAVFDTVDVIVRPIKKDNQFVTLLSPNGGEVYQTGEEININWITRGYSANTHLSIDLAICNEAACMNTHLMSTGCIINDRNESITVPSNVLSGNNYYFRIAMCEGGFPLTQDYSDEAFTINQVL